MKFAPLIGMFVLGLVVGAGGYAVLKPAAISDQPAGVAVGELSPLRGVSKPGSSDDTLMYTSKAYKFSLEYPKELTVQEFDEGGGSATIVFQKPGEQVGFQIFVTPYSGDSISEDRLKKDIPSGIVKDPVEVMIGKDGIRALIFWSEASIIGESREAWFIKNGNLFEITTYAALDEWIAKILATIDFE